jgi:hypothetical protein
VLLPGFVGNVFVGAVAALISYSLYGPFANLVIIRDRQAEGEPQAPPLHLTLAAFAGAILIGFTGGRWLTAETERQLNRKTAVTAAQIAEQLASRKASAQSTQPATLPQQVRELLQVIQTESPRQALEKALEVRRLTESPPGPPE